MPYDPSNPLIIQGDRTILLDVHTSRAAEARSALIPFAELEKSPEHLHAYRITPLSLWNAASAGFTPERIAGILEDLARFPVAQSVTKWVLETMGRFGKIRLVCVEPAPAADSGSVNGNAGAVDSPAGASDAASGEAEAAPRPDVRNEFLLLVTESPLIYRELAASKIMAKYLIPEPGEGFKFRLGVLHRGTVKQELLKLGWPVKDEAPLRDGDPLEVDLLDGCRSGKPLVIRDYQIQAAQALVGDKGPGTGFGTIVLPCGAGKTVVGMTVMLRRCISGLPNCWTRPILIPPISASTPATTRPCAR